MQAVHSARRPVQVPDALRRAFPARLTEAVTRCGAPAIEEIRLHRDRYATVTCCGRSHQTYVALDGSEMEEILKRLCSGSLYAYGESIRHGFVSLKDGIRVGVCGSAATENGKIIGVNDVTGLILRIPHAIPVSVSPVLERFCATAGGGGILIYAPPGVGKTTLLRAVAAQLSSPVYGYRTVVVDTRGELCYALNGRDMSLDILSGYPKEIGIEIAVRSLGAEVIVCDELGSLADAHAVLAAAGCGVPLIASAHATHLEDLLLRPSMRLLHHAHAFGCYVGLSRAHAGGFSYQFTDRKDVICASDDPREAL